MKRADLNTQTVLRAIAEHGMAAYEHLVERYPRKIVLAALEREDRAGRIDYGVSLTRPWLEPAGEAEINRVPNRVLNHAE